MKTLEQLNHDQINCQAGVAYDKHEYHIDRIEKEFGVEAYADNLIDFPDGSQIIYGDGSDMVVPPNWTEDECWSVVGH